MRYPAIGSACLLLLLTSTAGCTGHIVTQTGRAGPPLPAGSPVTIVAMAAGADDTARLARAAVERELAAQGHTISPDARWRVEIAVAERSAAVAMEQPGGATMSPAKRRHFLSRCAYRTQRLTLAVYDAQAADPIRTWAEEPHCRASLADNIAALARQAVSSLERIPPAGRSTRRGRN